MTLQIPTLETERMILRGPLESDFDTVAAFMASPRAEFIGGPQERFPAWRGFIGVLGHWALRGYGFWTLVDKTTNRLLGRVGFINHDGWQEPELGWHLFEGVEGHGFAYEAATAARRYGALHFGLDGVISYIDPRNTRSAALAHRLGASLETETIFFDLPCHIYRHPKLAALEETS